MPLEDVDLGDKSNLINLIYGKDNQSSPKDAASSSTTPSEHTMTDIDSGKHIVTKKPKEKKLVVCGFGSAVCLFILIILAIILSAFCGYWLTKQEYEKKIAHLQYTPVPRRNFSSLYGEFDEEEEEDESQSQSLVPTAEELKLPDTFEPIWYNITLKTYLPGYVNFPEEKNFTTEGNLLLKIKALKESDLIVLNSRQQKFPSVEAIKILSDDGMMRDSNQNEGESENSANSTRFRRNVDSTNAVERIWTNETLEKVFIKLKNPIQQGEEFILQIPYTAQIDDSLEGFFRSKYTTKDGQIRNLAISHLQPTYNRELLPSFDEPTHKAKWKLTIVHPKGTIARSNGMELEENSDLNSTDWVTTSFEETPLISSYLMGLTITDFTSAQAKTKSGTTVRVWARPEATEAGLTKFALQKAVEALDFLEDYYQIRQPMKKQDLFAVPDFEPGAMENPGIMMFRESRLLYDPANDLPSSLIYKAITVSHEVSHQWFGDLVTLSGWDSLWLNEAFATFMSNYVVNHTTPYYNALDYFAYDQGEIAYNADELASSHPLTMKIDTAADAYEIFDGITYSKGASVVRMIKAIMGEEAFRKGVQEYIKAHQFSNANYTDLWSALTSALPKDAKFWNDEHLDIEKFANPWILQMGYPVIDVYRLDANTVELTQRRFKLNNLTPEKAKFRNALYWYKWDVPIFYEINGEKRPMEWLHEALRIPLNLNDTLIINPDAEGFYRVNYDDETWQDISEQLNKEHTVYSPLTRLRILSDIFELAESGQQSYELALNISRYLSKEEHPYPFNLGVGKLLSIYGKQADSDENNKAKELMRSLLSEKDLEKFEGQNWDTIIDNDPENLLKESRDKTVLSIYCILEPRKCRDKMLALFNENLFKSCQNQNISSECSKVPIPLRDLVYCEGISRGEEEEFDEIKRLVKNEVHSTERDRLVSALGCSRDPVALRRLLLNILNPEKSLVKKQDLNVLLGSMNSNLVGREITTNFIIDNWKKVINRLKEDRDILTLFIRSGVEIRNERELKQMRQFLHDHRKTTRGFGTFRAKMDQARGKIQWEKMHSAEIQQYLNGTMNSGRENGEL